MAYDKLSCCKGCVYVVLRFSIFFYNNQIVCGDDDWALQQQAGMIDPKRYIGDMVLKSRIELLEQQVRELQRENGELEKKNKKLEKALDKKDLNLIKNL